MMGLFFRARIKHSMQADIKNPSRLTEIFYYVVPRRGLEPPHPKAHGPEPCASTISATWAGV